MRLTDLEPYFVRYEVRTENIDTIVGDQETWRERGSPTITAPGPRQFHVPVNSLAEAQGMSMLCPKCLADNIAAGGKRLNIDGNDHGPEGVHSIHVSFENRGVEPEQGSIDSHGRSSRWQITGGTGMSDLTLTPSILISKPGCGWHGWIMSGQITSC